MAASKSGSFGTLGGKPITAAENAPARLSDERIEELLKTGGISIMTVASEFRAILVELRERRRLQQDQANTRTSDAYEAEEDAQNQALAWGSVRNGL